MEESFYNHSTTVFFGKYKSKKIKEIPIDYILKIADNPGGCPDKWFIKYVNANREFLEAVKRGEKQFPDDEIVEDDTCQKHYYSDQKSAKTALRQIRETEQKHKKPVRTYQCDKCTGWHLTSVPIEVWKERQQIEKNNHSQ